MKTNIFKLGSALLLSGVILFTGCKKDEETEEDAPALLTEDTFVMDISEVGDTTSTANKKKGKWNKGTALTAIAVFNGVIKLNLITPIAAFRASFKHSPTFDKDNKIWTWSYTVGEHTARLTGKKTTTGVNWKMYIAKNGNNGFGEVLWYEGTSVTGVSGTWTVYRNPTAPIKYLQIDWTKVTGQKAGIKYTIIENGAANKGDYIEYGYKLGEELNRFYNISDADKGLVEIKWSHELKHGRIENGIDKTTKCWATNAENEICK